jgi:enamine deaminase RidA (YjgF/YER057c/UK114 family)
MPAQFVITNDEAARARVTSDLVIADGWGFVAGLAPVDLDNDRVALPEQVEAQTRKVLANLERVLAAAGLSKEHVVAVRVYLVDLPRLYERMNAGYAGFFAPGRLPARTCVGASALPRGALVAMDFTLSVAAKG